MTLAFLINGYLINPLKHLKKSWLFLLSLIFICALFSVKFSEAKAQNTAISTTQNCDSNAVIWCGASSVSQLANKCLNGDGHNSAASIQHIYSFYGISCSELNAMSSSNLTVVSGWVGKNNHVYDQHNKLVATGAITGGRQNINGSTREDIGGTVFFVRPPSVSFQNNFLSSFVFMRNNRFAFAVIASCGNAVKATPVPSSTPAPTPTPTPAPTPTPTPQTPQPSPMVTNNVCSGNTTNSQGGNCSTNTNVEQTQTIKNTNQIPPPAPPAPATPTETEEQPPSAPTTLVNTGPGNLVAIFVAVSIISTVGHHLFISRVKSKQQI